MSAKHRQIRPLRAATTAVIVLALGFTVVALVVRAQPVSSIPRLVIAVGATFVPLIALIAVALALLRRRVALAVLGICLLTATLAIQVNWYYSARPSDVPAHHIELRLLASNIRLGNADATSFVRLAKNNADIVTVAELTPDAVDRFARAGMDESFPFSLLEPLPGAGGIGVWSRFPISPFRAPGHAGTRMPAGWVALPGLDYKPLVASVHIMSPVAGDQNTVSDWSRGMAGAKAQLDNFAKEAGPGAVIIGGDYNSTPDMRQFRDLLTNGYRDAVEQIGAGYAPTFKADHWLPPVITIDHVLTRNAAASSIRTMKIEGSDHRALLASIKVPVDPDS